MNMKYNYLRFAIPINLKEDWQEDDPCLELSTNQPYLLLGPSQISKNDTILYMIIILKKDQNLFDTDGWRIYGSVSSSIKELFYRLSSNNFMGCAGFSIGMSVPI